MTTLQPALFDNSVGPELVTNGDGASTSGWSAGSGASMSSASGRFRVTATLTGTRSASQTVSGLTTGREYRASGETFAGTASSRRLRFNSGPTSLVSATDGNVNATFTTPATSVLVLLDTIANAGGQHAEFDNISLKATPFYSATAELGDPPALTPSLVTNSQTFYSPSVSASIKPTLFTNTQSFYAPLVAPEQALTVALLSNAQSFYSFTIAGAGTLRPSLFDNSETALFDDDIFDAVLFDTGQGFLTPTVSVGAVTLSPSLFTNTQTFFAGEIPPWRTLLPSLFGNTDAIYLPGVWGRPVASDPGWASGDGDSSDWTPVIPTDASWSGGDGQDVNWTPITPTDGSWA